MRARACRKVNAVPACLKVPTALCLSLGILAAVPAAAQTPGGPAGAMCGARDAVIARLQTKYGETRQGYGLQRGASVVEVFASDATGSWTILLTTPNGVSCLVAAGEHWAPIATAAAGTPL